MQRMELNDTLCRLAEEAAASRRRLEELARRVSELVAELPAEVPHPPIKAPVTQSLAPPCAGGEGEGRGVFTTSVGGASA